MSWFGIGAMAISAAGALYQGMASSAQAKSASNMSDYNAEVAENDAKSIEARTIVESQNQAEAYERQAAKLRAKAGASGVVITEGSPLLMLAEQEMQGIKENQMIGYRGVVSAQGMRSQATLDRTQSKIHSQRASNVKTASYIGAGATLMSGFSGPTKKPSGGQYSSTGDGRNLRGGG